MVSDISQESLIVWADTAADLRAKVPLRLSAATVAHYLDRVLAVGRWAFGRGSVFSAAEAPSWIHMDRMSRERRRRHVYSFSEIKQIIESISSSGAPHIAILLWWMTIFVCRPSGLMRLLWQDIFMPSETEDGFVEVAAMKRGIDVNAAIERGSERELAVITARTIWQEQHGRTPRPANPVFCPCYSPIRPWTESAFSRRASDVAARCGYESFTPYDLRHSVMTLMARGGIDSEGRRLIAGHRSAAAQQYYLHLSGADALPAVRHLDGLAKAHRPCFSPVDAGVKKVS
jgi:integrase